MNSHSDKIFAAASPGAATPAWSGRQVWTPESGAAQAGPRHLDAVLHRRRLAAAALERNLADQLRWLQRSGRLRQDETDLMVSQGVLTRDSRLPCQDPRAACRCPLAQRAGAGDRTAPCVEAGGDRPGDRAGSALGDPVDPVRLLQIRPCYLLGRLADAASPGRASSLGR